MENQSIPLDSSLGIEDVSEVSVLRLQVANVTGDHSVHPADAILTRNDKFGAPREVVDGDSGTQGLEFF